MWTAPPTTSNEEVKLAGREAAPEAALGGAYRLPARVIGLVVLPAVLVNAVGRWLVAE